MKSELPKVLHRVCGKPMISHVLNAAQAVCAGSLVVVLGHGSDQVAPYLPPNCAVAIQDRQGGTGHALLAARDQIPPGPVLVLPGDTPLVTGEMLESLVDEHVSSATAATVLTAVLQDPSGYGRIVRGPDGFVTRIVEHRDATPEERDIHEINTGIFILPAKASLEVLSQVGTDNDQGEIYLTDVVAGLRERGMSVAGSVVTDHRLVLGVNSPVELAEAEKILGERIKTRWMLSGVTIIDPASTLIEADVTLEPGVLIRPFTTLAGCSTVSRGSDIGPCSTLIDAQVAESCCLPHSYLCRTAVKPGTRLNPFSFIHGEGESGS